jgi:hypothetical protein
MRDRIESPASDSCGRPNATAELNGAAERLLSPAASPFPSRGPEAAQRSYAAR